MGRKKLFFKTAQLPLPPAVKKKSKEKSKVKRAGGKKKKIWAHVSPKMPSFFKLKQPIIPHNL